MPTLTKIAYLENEDVSDNGQLAPHVNPGNKFPAVIVMLQGDFCGYCQQMKPAFQQFADANRGKLMCATIKIDGSKSEQQVAAKAKKFVENYRGVPTVFAFKNGKYAKTHTGGRSAADLQKFAEGVM